MDIKIKQKKLLQKEMIEKLSNPVIVIRNTINYLHNCNSFLSQIII